MTAKNGSALKVSWRHYASLMVFLGFALVVPLTNLVWTTHSRLAPQQDTQVGTTSDQCNPARTVKFHGKSGEVIIKPGDSKRVEMPALLNEFHWFCGDSRERVANDDYFNVVKVSRDHSSGTISWKFYKGTPQPSTGSGNKPDLVKVGDTKDACDGQRSVVLKGTAEGDLKIKAGESKLVKMSKTGATIFWDCVQANGACPTGDTCDEQSSNPVAFRWVQLDRAGNGAMSWVFYREKNESTPLAPELPPTPKYVHNATGDVKVKLSPGLIPDPKFNPGHLKTQLDNFYNEKTADIRKTIEEELTKRGNEAADKLNGKFHLDPHWTLSDTNRNELRTAVKDGTLWVKYVAHHNVVNCGLLVGGYQADFVLRFDLQLEFALPRLTIDKIPQTPKAPARLAHIEIEGTTPHGDIAQEVFKSKLEDVKWQARSVNLDFTDEINDALKGIWAGIPSIPKDLFKTETSISKAGTIRLCLRAANAPECNFGPEEAVHVPKVLDSTGGGCGEGLLWLRDAETQRFTSIAKGKSALIEVDSRRFNWYCGGSQGPEAQEWESGPVGTYFAHVSRNSERGITFKFLSWR